MLRFFGRCLFLAGFVLLPSTSFADDPKVLALPTTKAPASPPQAGPAPATMGPAGMPGAPTPSKPPADNAESLSPPKAAALPLDAQEGEDELTLDEWERDEWAHTRPRVALLDIAGYFRVRGDMLRRLDFGNDAKWEQVRGEARARYPHAAGQQAGYNQLSMRLRLEPRLHVSDSLQVMSTVDVLDNLVLGSTPSTLPGLPPGDIERPAPNVLATGQVPVRRGLNSFSDSIVVKRLWTKVGFLHDRLELKVGRMPDHFGLGMWLNSGDCLNCDGGTVVDRVALSFRALGHVFMPHIDWVSRGPLRQVFGQNDLTPVAAMSSAGALNYGLRISKEEHPDDIRDALAHGRSAVEYGLLNALRVQSSDVPLAPYQDAINPYTQVVQLSADVAPEPRDARVYQGDAYAKWYRRNVELGAEAAVLAGTFKDTINTVGNPGVGQAKTTVLQLGVAAEALWHLREDRRGTRLSLKLGGASGDSHAGFGARELADTQRGQENGRYDRKLTAFQFSPDYHLDLLLMRRLIGTVTDLAYVRPEVAYRFDDKLSGRLAVIYTQAMTSRSTPSSNLGAAPGSLPLGVEVDGEMAYGLLTRDERGQMLASLAGGILQPLPGMRSKPDQKGSVQSGKFAWTLQARLFVTF